MDILLILIIYQTIIISNHYVNTFLIPTFMQDKFHSETDIDKELLNYLSTHPSNETTLICQCLRKHTTLQLDVKQAEIVLYPFDMEFCLVAAGMLISMLLPLPQPTGRVKLYSESFNIFFHFLVSTPNCVTKLQLGHACQYKCTSSFTQRSSLKQTLHLLR